MDVKPISRSTSVNDVKKNWAFIIISLSITSVTFAVLLLFDRILKINYQVWRLELFSIYIVSIASLYIFYSNKRIDEIRNDHIGFDFDHNPKTIFAYIIIVIISVLIIFFLRH